MGRVKVKCFWPKVLMFMLMQAIEQDIISLNKTGQKTRILQLRTNRVLNNPGIKRASSAVHFDTSIVLDFRYITCKKSALQDFGE